MSRVNCKTKNSCRQEILLNKLVINIVSQEHVRARSIAIKAMTKKVPIFCRNINPKRGKRPANVKKIVNLLLQCGHTVYLNQIPK